MKTPALLLGAALLFWGWQTGLWLLAVPMAVIVEGANFLRWRWDLSAEDYKRIAQLCLVLLAVLIVYLVSVNPSIFFIYTLLRWLPGILFPLLAAQVCSMSDRIDLRTLFLFAQPSNDHDSKFAYNLTYPYFAVCILAASATNSQNLSFYAGLFTLTAIALWSIRAKRSSAVAWISLMLLAGSLGFVGQIGLHQLHLKFEQQAVEWLANASGQSVDFLQKNTAIGDIGSLKLSNKIVFRVDPGDRQPPPRLLRQATYDQYKSSTWFAANSSFTPIMPEADGTTWRIGQSFTPASTIAIAASLPGGKGVLALPDSTFQLNQLSVSSLERSSLGTVKVTGSSGFIGYQIQFGQGVSFDSPPTEADLQIVSAEQATLEQILRQLDLENKSPSVILSKIEQFFQRDFTYSLELANSSEASTPLSAFLLQSRSGHCEYFATATTLLLRAAGIPARYAIGYSIHEFSPLENQFIVRERHAHAWTLAYLDGNWQAIDTTPASWSTIEQQATSQWHLISDLWAWLGFKVTTAVRQLRSISGLQHLWWFGLILILIPVWKLNRNKRVRRLALERVQLKSVEQPKTGADSEFYLVEQAFSDVGLSRYPSEPLRDWVKRLKQEMLVSTLVDELQPILELHYRYRFDPKGIEAAEREQLRSLIHLWLEEFAKHNSKSQENQKPSIH